MISFLRKKRREVTLMTDYPIFANAKTFAKISGRPLKEVRRICSEQKIPNERTGRDYLIPVEAALNVLKERAEKFVGHRMIISYAPNPCVRSLVRTHRKTGVSFLDQCNELLMNDH